MAASPETGAYPIGHAAIAWPAVRDEAESVRSANELKTGMGFSGDLAVGANAPRASMGFVDGTGAGARL